MGIKRFEKKLSLNLDFFFLQMFKWSTPLFKKLPNLSEEFKAWVYIFIWWKFGRYLIGRFFSGANFTTDLSLKDVMIIG